MAVKTLESKPVTSTRRSRATNAPPRKPFLTLEFVQPIIGFPDHTRYELVSDPDIAPMQWLRAVGDDEHTRAEQTNVAFPVVSPFVIKHDYGIDLAPADVEDLDLRGPHEARLVCILVLSNTVDDIRANMRAPIIYNARNLKAKQVVLQDNDQPIRYFFATAADGSRTDIPVHETEHRPAAHAAPRKPR